MTEEYYEKVSALHDIISDLEALTETLTELGNKETAVTRIVEIHSYREQGDVALLAGLARRYLLDLRNLATLTDVMGLLNHTITDYKEQFNNLEPTNNEKE